MFTFKAFPAGSHEKIRLTLDSKFSLEHWSQLERFYQNEVAQGCLQWVLDLSRMSFMSSMLLGMIVGFNTLLATRGGQLNLFLGENHRLIQLFAVTRLDQIISIEQPELEAGQQEAELILQNLEG